MAMRGTPGHFDGVTPVLGRSRRLIGGSDVSVTEVVGAIDVVVEEVDAFDDAAVVVVVASGAVVVEAGTVVVVVVSSTSGMVVVVVAVSFSL